MAERYSPNSAFLNIPYDRRYESLFLSFIAGLCGFGLRPRATPVAWANLDKLVTGAVTHDIFM